MQNICDELTVTILEFKGRGSNFACLNKYFSTKYALFFKCLPDFSPCTECECLIFSGNFLCSCCNHSRKQHKKMSIEDYQKKLYETIHFFPYIDEFEWVYGKNRMKELDKFRKFPRLF